MATLEQTREEVLDFCRTKGLPWTKVSVGYKQSGGELTDEEAVIVGVPEKIHRRDLLAQMQIPVSIDGHRTDVQAVTYKIPPLMPWPARPEQLTEQHRPFHPGDSIGERTITAGTTGAFVRVEGVENICVLSNAHVLAATNDAPHRSWIFQPGTADGGGADDLVAHLERRVHINFPGDEEPPPDPDLSCLDQCLQEFQQTGNFFGLVVCAVGCLFNGASVKSLSLNLQHARIGAFTVEPDMESVHRARIVNFQNAARAARADNEGGVVRQEKNYVDAAIAELTTDDWADVDAHHLGPAKGTVDLKLGDPVEKVGRTTEKSTGRIIEVGATVRVDYGTGIATTEDQLISDLRSAGGDSGSIIRHTDDRIGGLLFAGGGGQTILNRIQHVERLLGVEFL